MATFLAESFVFYSNAGGTITPAGPLFTQQGGGDTQFEVVETGGAIGGTFELNEPVTIEDNTGTPFPHLYSGTLTDGSGNQFFVFEDTTFPGFYTVVSANHDSNFPSVSAYPASINLATDLTTTNFLFCFAAGSLIATPDGEVAVETLKIGDLVVTETGAAVPVKWLGVQNLHKWVHGRNMEPVLIKAGALGNGAPHSDLTVTADHGMIIDGMVINAAALVNGDTIDFVPLGELPDSVAYYHVETENHDVILANGTLAETFVDMQGRKGFDNYKEYLDLYGAERIIPSLETPRITNQRQLPEAIKRRLGIADIEHKLDMALTA